MASRRKGHSCIAQNDNGGNAVAAYSASAQRHCAPFNAPQHETMQASVRSLHRMMAPPRTRSPRTSPSQAHPERWVERRGIAGRARPANRIKIDRWGRRLQIVVSNEPHVADLGHARGNHTPVVNTKWHRETR